MIRPDVEIAKWSKVTGADTGEWQCSKCGDSYPINIPVASKDYHGFESPVHGCGPGFTAVILTARSSKKKELWNYIFGNL